MEQHRANRTVQCPRCGKVFSFEKFEPFDWFIDAWAIKLYQFIAGKLDKFDCPVCRHEFEFKQSIFVLLQDPPLVAGALGDYLTDDSEKLLPELMTFFQIDKSDKLVLAATHDELRKLVLKRMAEYGEVFVESNSAAESGNMREYMAENWRKYTPERFVAADFLLKIGKLKAFDSLENIERAQSDAEPGFWRLQALTWTSLCKFWSQPEKDMEGAFETDLNRYLFSPAMNRQAIAEFDEIVNLIAGQQPGGSFRYCLEAVRATLYAAMGQPNPFVEQWTRMLIEFEVFSSSPGSIEKEKLLKLRLSDERVRSTVEYRAVFDTFLSCFQSEADVFEETCLPSPSGWGFRKSL